MRNLRVLIAYAELERALPADDGGQDDAAWTRRLFREELASFRQLVAHAVTHKGVMVHARDSLRLAWSDCAESERFDVNENWARVAPEDVRVGVLNDLQLVAPRIWIGSTDTLTYTELLDARDVRHVVYCTTTTRPETRLTREDSSASARSLHVVTVFDLPRQQFEDAVARVDGMQQLVAASSSSCGELAGIVAALDALLNASSDALLLYCSSGLSTSIGVCAALLLTRYKLPLRVVLPLLHAARRDISLSQHLHLQLEQLDASRVD